MSSVGEEGNILSSSSRTLIRVALKRLNRFAAYSADLRQLTIVFYFVSHPLEPKESNHQYRVVWLTHSPLGNVDSERLEPLLPPRPASGRTPP